MRRYGVRALQRQGRLGTVIGDESTVLASMVDPPLGPHGSLLELVEAVRALPYGRPRDRSITGLLRERRGTCSTKHLFLARVLAERFPETKPRIVHRVYRVEQEWIRDRYGSGVAEVVPDNGLIDVHRYLWVRVEGLQITLDATFPGGERWDGRSSLPLACGRGDDAPAGDDPDADKRALEARYCDPVVREPFIAALGHRCALIPSVEGPAWGRGIPEVDGSVERFAILARIELDEVDRPHGIPG